jgi:hypothetical protein
VSHMAVGWDLWDEHRTSSWDGAKELLDTVFHQLDSVATAVQIGDIDGAIALHGTLCDSCAALADEVHHLRSLASLAMHPSLAD